MKKIYITPVLRTVVVCSAVILNTGSTFGGDDTPTMEDDDDAGAKANSWFDDKNFQLSL